ncbi:ParD-like family protein [Alkalimarinus alittae]|uniref:ParD-like family protein n=1 Tax=Alkalimarinus alittae TaxID=2961619 RepID=A0ABY6N391_9ALTE|nr:ParD-like family protein [Alkalimarinus alittae]UZE96504.1 ParD-like family protein [Alkalimarinus alittae]
MAKSVRLSDELVNTASQEGRFLKRSAAGQIEYWAEIGKLVEQTGCFSLSRIRSFQEGHVSIDDLTPDERIAASRSLFEQLAEAPNRDSVINELNSSAHPYYSASNGQISASKED